MAGKRYYWLRLKDDFFDSKRIKKMRRMFCGDTMVIIYFKLQLKAMKNEGYLVYDGIESSFAEELALDLDETVEDVQTTLDYLLKTGLCTTDDELAYFFPYAVENVGSEGASAQRTRAMRERQASQCDTDVTLMCHNVTPTLSLCDGEKEIEIDKREIVIDRENRKREEGEPRGNAPIFTAERVFNNLGEISL